jgi:hypothetical protein
LKPVSSRRCAIVRYVMCVCSADGEDTSAARPMADTRFGDIVDVLTEAAAADVVARYRVVVVAGHVVVGDSSGSNSLAGVLMEYVMDGGVVMVAVGNIGNSSAGVLLTGFVPNGHFPTSRAWSVVTSSPLQPSFTREALSFAAGSLAPEDPFFNTSTSALVQRCILNFIYSLKNVTLQSDTHRRFWFPSSRRKTHIRLQIWQCHHVHSPLVRRQ